MQSESGCLGCVFGVGGTVAMQTEPVAVGTRNLHSLLRPPPPQGHVHVEGNLPWRVSGSTACTLHLAQFSTQ